MSRADGGGRGRWRTAPLRIRLLLCTFGLLAGVCVVVGAITLLLLRGFLLHQLDGQLTAAGYRAVALSHRGSGEHLGHDRDGDDHDGVDGNGDDHQGADHDGADHDGTGPGFLGAPGQTVGTLGGQVSGGRAFDGTGFGVIDQDGGVSPADPKDLAALAAVPIDGHPVTVTLGVLGAYRVIGLHGSGGGTVLTGLPLDPVSSVLSRLLVIELVVAGAGSVVAGAAATVIVRVTLRPLERVAATARRVAELPLDRGEVELPDRIPRRDTDPRTEVGQVGAGLNRMLEHIGSALAARQASETRLRRFLADASHELRTPLAAIRGYAELAGRSAPEIPPDTAFALRRVASQTERMSSLIEDMFLLARLDSGRPLLADPVELSQLLVDGMSDAHAAGPDHHWRLRLPDQAVTVTGDPTRLAQVLANLLANARVHTPPGTTVTAELDTDSADAVLRVSDDGPGVPPELLPHVFSRFARGEVSRSRTAGSSTAGSTGLGLAIAHAVVAAHGGVLGVRSGPGHTAFTVRLPRRPSTGPTTPTFLRAAPTCQRRTSTSTGALSGDTAT